ncbi:thiamine-phosphate diphosphorylase [Acididesulfobacillus acetoxydans]|uniref:Ribulose-phosphate binding barrel protein n=1 Tax=Acididesulfobacillus acetoxydans TaxID=1561005 RepID=A0A8S0Y3N4_9FIRM|nr:haloacid dehalogenase-like hydrolase [Acididesulfobacillus acetoxydans]CAA7602245.1 thiamine-phosphate diphosphorylase [Acididesulfobacillus acetoxydans]CEJ07537.1 Ribulose-phosphate binding barrel protein [Acididesulfobacillus acetoxydans]
MAKRVLDCSASDFRHMSAQEILEGIAAAEGRTLVAEIIGALQPVLMSVSNAELAAAFGADILLLNFFDVYAPVFQGLPATSRNEDSVIQNLERLTGRLIGINLEPVDPDQETLGEIRPLPPGRLASADTAREACRQGTRLIMLTGNPGSGVSNRAISRSLRAIRDALGRKIILGAGKMHAAGSRHEAGANLINHEDVAEFVAAGADIILLPAPGTVPGLTVEYAKSLVDRAHSLGALTLTVIGTSQEGADPQTLRQIALMCKMTGTDLHHLGDAGAFLGIATPENIMAYSITIRGKRHTYARMARSVNR